MSTAVPEEHRELLDAPYAVLTTLGGDGYPQSTMVTFLAEDGLVRISLNTTRQKTRNLIARPGPPCSSRTRPAPIATWSSAATWRSPDDDYRFARQVGRKYGGTDFRYADRPGESRVGVFLHPVRVNVTDLRPRSTGSP